MPSDYLFRLSTFLTLGLACACLGYAEWAYLPEVTIFTLVIGVGLIAAFRAEGKFELSLTAANWVGAGIFVLAVGWIALHWRIDTSLIHTLPWPAGLLPFLAPLVMILMPAKLFRPKHVGDWWALHGVGLASVGLASSLAEDVGFLILLSLYAIVGIWSLSLFYQRRTAGLVAPVPQAKEEAGLLDLGAWFPWLLGRGNASPVVAGPPETRMDLLQRSRHRHWYMPRSLGWLAFAFIMALPLFLFTPRSESARWNLSRGRAEVGYSPELTLDMSRTGELLGSQELAFEVTVKDQLGNPVDAFTPEQRWRGTAYVEYASGKWNRTTLPNIWRGGASLLGGGRLPDFGPDSLFIEYKMADRMRGVLLADPVYYAPGKPSPVIYQHRGETANAVQNWDSSFLALPAGRLTTYRQVYRMPLDDRQGVPFIRTDIPGRSGQSASLVRRPPQGIGHWTRRLVDQMIRQGELPQQILERRHPITEFMAEEDYKTVALAFEKHLAESPDYSYSLTVTRQDRSLDPIEDFLLNTRAGHCERFASALVLMLRSVGIPSQFVLGFKGCEPQGDGKYIVRQEHAHAWVEVLLPVDDERWQWYTLDPTPRLIQQEETGTSVSLWASAKALSQRVFTDYIVGFTPENQRQLKDAGRNFLRSNGPLLGTMAVMVGMLVASLLWWRSRRRTPEAIEETPAISSLPWYTRMVESLKVAGLPMRAGMTPREYAQYLTQVFEKDPAYSTAKGIPHRVALALYKIQYSGKDLGADEIASLNQDVDQLIATVANAGHGKT